MNKIDLDIDEATVLQFLLKRGLEEEKKYPKDLSWEEHYKNIMNKLKKEFPMLKALRED